MDFSKVNPTVAFLGLLALVIGAGVGEYFHVVPAGSASVLMGALTGGGIYHIASNQATTAALATPTPPPPAASTGTMGGAHVLP